LVALVVQRRDSQALLRHSRQLSHELEEERTRLEQRVAERTRQLETSAAISRQLSTILDRSQLVREVVESLRTAFAYYQVQVYLWDEDSSLLHLAGGTGTAGQELLVQGHAVTPGQGLVGLAFSTNQAIIAPDVVREPGWLRDHSLPETRAEIALPIASGSQVLGVLDVQDDRAGALGAADAQLLQAIAGQLAVALNNAGLVAQIRQEARQAALINVINHKITQTTDIEGAVRVALMELSQALHAQQITAHLHVEETANVDGV
jgi:putative methionine-R-sulfoxide reductase with GAF domain